MPRDFVPCLYREYVMPTRALDTPQWCCDMTELYDVCLLGSREAEVVFGLDSYQTRLTERYRAVEPDGLPDAEDFAAMRGRMRTAVSHHFYAAMAALE